MVSDHCQMTWILSIHIYHLFEDFLIINKTLPSFTTTKYATQLLCLLILYSDHSKFTYHLHYHNKHLSNLPLTMHINPSIAHQFENLTLQVSPYNPRHSEILFVLCSKLQIRLYGKEKQTQRSCKQNEYGWVVVEHRLLVYIIIK